MLNPIAYLLIKILSIYEWIVILAVIVSWLTAFNVINVHNNFVRAALRVLFALTEPIFRQIRKVIPAIAGLDLSPLVVIVLLEFFYVLDQVAGLSHGNVVLSHDRHSH